MTIDITEARALVETLKDYAEHPSSFTDISPTEADAAADMIESLIADVRTLEDVVEHAGFRRCDAPTCNCGSWHQVGGFKARFDEIKEAVAEHINLNGMTLLNAVKSLLAERDAAVLAEREACAQILDSVNNNDNPMTARDCAAEIRARSER